MATTAKGYPYPVGGDAPDGPVQIQALATAVDASPGVAPLTYAAINALAGGNLWDGRRVYQTNTGTNRPVKGEYTYNGVSWRLPWNMPWGLAADPTSITTDATSYTGYATVPGLAQTITMVANRWIQVRFTAPFHNGTAGNGALAKLLDGATRLTEGEFGSNSASNGLIDVVYTGTFTVGSHTITPQVAHDVAGAVNLDIAGTKPAQLVVTDLGPAGIPT